MKFGERELKNWDNKRDFSILVGQTIKAIAQSTYQDDAQFIIFETTDYTYKMYHEQDCCERVTIKDIDGQLQELIGQQILLAECRQNFEEDDLETWTFYTIRTIKTSVDISWLGESNGHYSERVDFVRIK